MSVKNIFENNIDLHKRILADEDLINRVNLAAGMCRSALENGGKILICGNGGSAADAQHFAAELVGRFQKERKGLAAIALSVDTSILTSLANDYSFENIFERQLEALGKEGDILFGISTSGNSENVIRAFRHARECGVKTIGLLGRDGGKLAALSDIAIIVPHSVTARIQEAHITIIHSVCELIEEAY